MPETAAAPETIWKEAFVLVMSAAVDHMVHCAGPGSDEIETFRRQAKASLQTLQEAADSQQVLITAGALSQAITQYLASAQRRIDLLAAVPGTDASGPRAATSNAFDPCTNLPTRAEAESALERAVTNASQTYAAVFYLHRMAMINARFGEAIGNQMLLFCSQHIASRLTHAGDSLFRWSGPAFLAILDRSDAYLSVSNDVQRMVSVPLSRFIETPSRSVYLPMKVTAEVFPLFKTTSEEALRRIERFIVNASS